MGDLHEIVDLNAVNRLFLILAVIIPVLGILTGYLVGKRKASFKRSFLSWTFVGLLGPLNLLMWTIYNSLANSNGIDSVRNLSLNFFIFLSVGGVAGILYHRLQSSFKTPDQAIDANIGSFFNSETKGKTDEAISQNDNAAD